MPPLNQANQALSPVFAQANQAIQAQTPAIQNLYQSLIQGLQAQQAGQVQNVVQSAEARGVGRAGLAGDVQAQLGQELALQSGVLGLQEAQDLSGAGQAAGKLSTERGTRVVDLATSLQDAALGEKEAKIKRQQIERQFKLDARQAERDFKVRETAYAKQQAEEAARTRAAAKEASQEDVLGALYSGINDPKNKILGKDGKMSPNTWNTMLDAWRREGGSVGTFVSSFKDFVNYEHQYAGRNDLIRYAGLDTWE